METFACFIDLQAAYDLVPRDLLFPALESCGLPTTIVQILHSVCESAEFCVRVGAGATSNAFQSGRGLLQGSVVSPALFNVYLQVNINEVCHSRHYRWASQDPL